MRSRSTLAGMALSGLAFVACGGASPGDPGATFADLEDRLLSARSVSFDYHVTAEGAIEADIEGHVEIVADGSATLSGEGSFAGRPVDLSLLAEGDRFQYSNGTTRAAGGQPEQLRESLLIGLTRMGVLHNLARLVSGSPPDHAEGGVREWVTVSSFAADDAAVSFDISVAGEPAGSAALELDEAGLPAVRRQTVVFEEGEMQVTETYRLVSVTPRQ